MLYKRVYIYLQAINNLQSQEKMKKSTLIIGFVSIGMALATIILSNSKQISELDALVLENIKALSTPESPVQIPCYGMENEHCKFLTSGSDGIWRHIEIENMKHV